MPAPACVLRARRSLPRGAVSRRDGRARDRLRASHCRPARGEPAAARAAGRAAARGAGRDERARARSGARRLVEEVTKLLDADAADCYLLDRERGVLRCAAVHGFDEGLVGFEFARARCCALALARHAPSRRATRVAGPHPPTTASRARSSHRWSGPARRSASSASASARRALVRGFRPRAARRLRVARVARVAQRRDLRGPLASGARPARLLSHRIPARRAALAPGDLRRGGACGGRGPRR